MSQCTTPPLPLSSFHEITVIHSMHANLERRYIPRKLVMTVNRKPLTNSYLSSSPQQWTSHIGAHPFSRNEVPCSRPRSYFVHYMYVTNTNVQQVTFMDLRRLSHTDKSYPIEHRILDSLATWIVLSKYT